MKTIYFLEVNLICVIFLMFLNHKTTSRKKSSVSDRLFTISVFCSVLLCITDAVMGVIDSKIFPGAILLNNLMNSTFFTCGTLTAFGWMLFVCTKVSNKFSKRFAFLSSIPFILVMLLILSNPFTHFIFLIDENNTYIRGSLIYIQWISICYYLIYATVLSILATRKEYNRIVRKMYLSYCVFSIFPLIGFIIQVFVYGVSTTTTGIALGYLFYYVKSLENQISEDSLTGLNNRKQLEKYVDDLIHKNPDGEIFVMMMDLNGFKGINDTYGHTAGDLALKDFAASLRTACRKWRGHYMLCRYGGDEFAVVGEYLSYSDLNVFDSLIRESVKEITIINQRNYTLSTSIGSAVGVCKKPEDFTHLYKQADSKMYEDKKRQKAAILK